MSKIKVISYNLRDLSEDAAIAKGEVFHQCWQEFKQAEAERKLAEEKAQAAEQAAAQTECAP